MAYKWLFICTHVCSAVLEVNHDLSFVCGRSNHPRRALHTHQTHRYHRRRVVQWLRLRLLRSAKKRNWKGLGLDVTQPPPSPQPEPLPIPVASRPAPSPANAKGASATGGAKKRPPGLSLGTKGPAKGASVPQHDDGMLTIPDPSSAQGTGSASPFRSNYQSTLAQQLEALSLGQVALKAEDLREVCDLGSGNSGSVKKVLHVPTGTLMAKKVRRTSSRSALRNATVLLPSKPRVYFFWRQRCYLGQATAPSAPVLIALA